MLRLDQLRRVTRWTGAFRLRESPSDPVLPFEHEHDDEYEDEPNTSRQKNDLPQCPFLFHVIWDAEPARNMTPTRQHHQFHCAL